MCSIDLSSCILWRFEMSALPAWLTATPSLRVAGLFIIVLVAFGSGILNAIHAITAFSTIVIPTEA